jgi:hypothetical protein
MFSMWHYEYIFHIQVQLWEAKNPINFDGWNHHRENKKEAKKRSNDMRPTRTKVGRKLALFVVGNYFTHNLSNVINMQIMRFNK